METMEFQVDSCVLVVATFEKKLGLHFGEELPTEREFGNFVDHYAVAVKNDSSHDVPLRYMKTHSEVICLLYSEIFQV